MIESSGRIFLRFLRFGFLAWGGPVAQIAMIKKELVEEEKWVSKEEFNRALAVYQALPGPEAHELCVYFGMKAGGRKGGLLAGLGFMLPGFLLMLLFTWLYVKAGMSSPQVVALMVGVQSAVIALIVFAVYRIGKHAVINWKLLLISLVAASAFFIGMNFIVVLLASGLAYLFYQKNDKWFLVMVSGVFFGLFTWQLFTTDILRKDQLVDREVQVTVHKNPGSLVLLTGLKAGLLTFGGAYTAIPFVQQDALKNGWMTRQQFLDGIAISGILPAPLIIFSTFVGYFGAGWIGALLITIGVFLPAFAFTLIGFPVVERLIKNRSLHHFLDGITAGVVGLIGITAIQLFYSTITGFFQLIVFIIALAVLIKFRSKYTAIFVILGSALAGILWNYF